VKRLATGQVETRSGSDLRYAAPTSEPYIIHLPPDPPAAATRFPKIQDEEHYSRIGGLLARRRLREMGWNRTSARAGVSAREIVTLTPADALSTPAPRTADRV